MEDENIHVEEIEEFDSPEEALETYAQLIEHQQEMLSEKQATVEQQADVINRLNMQVEALRDSLHEQTEATVYMKSEAMLAQQREQGLKEQLQSIRSMMGMAEDDTDGADSRET